MKILNLDSGIGGNRHLWGDNHSITAVEINPEIAAIYKSNNPDDNVIIVDAHEYLLQNYDKFDFIWTSPPCQSHSKMMKATRHDVRKYPNMQLYQRIILLNNFFNGYWIVENVNPYYKPLIPPTRKVGRHLFWANFKFEVPEIPKIKDFINKSNKKAAQQLKDWLGIQYKGDVYYDGNHCPCQVLRNCVHPKIGESILNQVNKMYHSNQYHQIKLF